ncbi:uncharacterized protein LOC143017862 isoform X3 [Oratosquilla oratoria]|uniref:uncharacterized protein LOC143017862 isoform X3 n=1 Tax=Oratosquilla oratoria TaxID=337810 RepID=UPI003F773040
MPRMARKACRPLSHPLLSPKSRSSSLKAPLVLQAKADVTLHAAAPPPSTSSSPTTPSVPPTSPSTPQESKTRGSGFFEFSKLGSLRKKVKPSRQGRDEELSVLEGKDSVDNISQLLEKEEEPKIKYPTLNDQLLVAYKVWDLKEGEEVSIFKKCQGPSRNVYDSRGPIAPEVGGSFRQSPWCAQRRRIRPSSDGEGHSVLTVTKDEVNKDLEEEGKDPEKESMMNLSTMSSQHATLGRSVSSQSALRQFQSTLRSLGINQRAIVRRTQSLLSPRSVRRRTTPSGSARKRRTQGGRMRHLSDASEKLLTLSGSVKSRLTESLDRRTLNESAPGTPRSRVGSGKLAPSSLAPQRHRRRPGLPSRRGACALREIRWKVRSGLFAVRGSGRYVVSGVRGVGARVREAVRQWLAALSTMGDSKIQNIKRSISSWSLSTFKKPKISGAKFKAPKIFKRSKKNRVETEDVAEATAAAAAAGSVAGGGPGHVEDEDLCRALLFDTTVDLSSSQIIHEPDKRNAQPKIVLTVPSKDEPEVQQQEDEMKTEEVGGGEEEIEFVPGRGSPGLLRVADKIDYIDSDEEVSAMGNEDENYYNEQFFDAKGGLYRSREDLNLIDQAEEYENYKVSKYYEATDDPKCENNKMSKDYGSTNNVNEIENTATCYEDVVVSNDAPEVSPSVQSGSVKAKEWVKTFNEEASKRAERWLQKHSSDKKKLPKSRSEVRLGEEEEEEENNRWSNDKNEIVLNATQKTNKKGALGYLNFLRKEFNAKVNFTPTKDKEKHGEDCEVSATDKTDLIHKESVKKIFEVRGKLSIKPIVDNKDPAYKETDIYIASSPLALSSGMPERKALVLTDSSDCDDGILNYSTDVEGTPGIEAHFKAKEEDRKESSMPIVVPKIVIDHGTPDNEEESELEQDETIPDNEKEVSSPMFADNKKSEVNMNDKYIDKEAEDYIGAGQEYEEKQIEKNDSKPEADSLKLSDDTKLDLEDVNEQGDTCVSASEVDDFHISESVTNADTTLVEALNTQVVSAELHAEPRGSAEEIHDDTQIDHTKDATSENIPEKSNIPADQNNENILEAVPEKTNKKINLEDISNNSQHENIRVLDKKMSEKNKICNIGDSKDPEEAEVDEETVSEQNQITTEISDKLIISSKSDPDTKKAERKKKKLPGASLSKSIKSFAGQLFSPSGEVKDNKDTGKHENKVRSRIRISPFNRESPAKASPKPTPSPERTQESDTKQEKPDKCPSLTTDVAFNQHRSPENKPIPDNQNKELSKASPDPGNVEENLVNESERKFYKADGEIDFGEDETSEGVGDVQPDKTVETDLSPDLHPVPVSLESETEKIVEVRPLLPQDELPINNEVRSSEPDQQCIKSPGLKDDNDDQMSTSYASFVTAVGDIKSILDNKDSSKGARNGIPSEKELFDSENISLSKVDQIHRSDSNEESEKEKVPDVNITNEANQTPLPIIPTVVQELVEEIKHQHPEDQTSPSKAENKEDEIPQVTPAIPHQAVEPPRPNPRTKKNRYGYAKSPLAVTNLPLPDSSDKSSLSSQSNQDRKSSTSSQGTSEHSWKSAEIPNVVVNTDSGYGGYDGYADGEHLYWEIGNTNTVPPRPSPRTKKGKKTPGDVSSDKPRETKASTLRANQKHKGITPAGQHKEDHRSLMPAWIHERGPIPSPRSKKGRSMQSLPTMVGQSSGVEDDGGVQGTKEQLLRDAQRMKESGKKNSRLPSSPAVPTRMKRGSQTSIASAGADMSDPEGLQMYGTKAASIAYGYTPNRAEPPPALAKEDHDFYFHLRMTLDEPIAPMPLLRSKKPSLISLPAGVGQEEEFPRHQKRGSLYGERPGNDFKNQHQRQNTTGESVPPPLPPRPQSLRRRRQFKSSSSYTPDLLQNSSGNSALQDGVLLADAVYTVHSLMGTTGQWGVKAGHGTNPSIVTLSQCHDLLQELFRVTPDNLQQVMEQVKERQPPEVNLHLRVIEAKGLRPKNVNGTSNPYCTACVVGGTGDTPTQRTPAQRNTLKPQFNQDFVLYVDNLQKDILKVEVRHEHQAPAVSQLSSVRDMRSLGRLVKGTTAQTYHHQTSHLLGTVAIPLKEVGSRPVENWFPLEKSEEDLVSSPTKPKDRGSLSLCCHVTSDCQLTQPGRKSYDALLAKVVQHEVAQAATINQNLGCVVPWNGKLSPASSALLDQFALILSLSISDLQLSWWLVVSSISSIDQELVFNRLRNVQTSLSNNNYKDEEVAEVRHSMTNWVRAHVEKLKDLMTAYPTSMGVTSQHQLAFALKNFALLETRTELRTLLDQEGLPPVHDMLVAALTLHAKSWWKELIEETLRNARTADEQIPKVLTITSVTKDFLAIAKRFYHDVIIKESGVSYFELTYLMLTTKINPCVRPLLYNMYNRITPISTQDLTVNDPSMADDKVLYALGAGTDLWQLYRNLGSIHELGQDLPTEVQQDSGVREYHRWFSQGVMRWLEQAHFKAQEMISKAVDLDDFNPIDDYCNFSSSAIDTTNIFHDVKIWWQKLDWPDLENRGILLTKILEDVCSCGTIYSDLLIFKVHSLFRTQADSDRISITKQHAKKKREKIYVSRQICTGLNNIERVRNELTCLPSHFGQEDLLERLRQLPNGEVAAGQHEATVNALIVHAAENMEAKVVEFIETVISKLRLTLEKAVIEACEVGKETPLLDLLEENLELLHKHLDRTNFQRFLWRLWEDILIMFQTTVSRNLEKRKATYFHNTYRILEKTLDFFCPEEEVGLDRTKAQIPEYTSLMELLSNLRLPSESLIARYYQERHTEQTNHALPTTAQLVVKAFFTRTGRLQVEVIMAKDMVIPDGFEGAPDSYIKVQLVPSEWFMSTGALKTDIQYKSDPAVYQKVFEFLLTPGDDGVKAGHLLFTLKDYNLGRTNKFIGEAIIPLVELPCVDSADFSTVPNTYLDMTVPGPDYSYKTLLALKKRTGDRLATSFLKKILKRFPESKRKCSGSNLRLDEAVPRPRSPNFIERLKLS